MMVFQDTYAQPDAPDPVLDAEQVLSLVRRHAPEARAVTAIDESGGEARAYAVDGHLVLKTQRPHRLRPRTSLEKEVCFLRHLAVDNRISAPLVLGYGRDGGVEYICMTRMAGVAARHAQLGNGQRAATLRQLGQTLRRIHELPQQPLLRSGLFPTDHTPADLRLRLSSAFNGVANVIAKTPEIWQLPLPPEEVAAAALNALPPEEAAFVALHSNPGPEHVFVEPGTGMFSGLIDFGDAYISHPALDLCQWRAQGDRAALLEGYAVEAPVSDTFLITWRSALILAEMRAIALRRRDPDVATRSLRAILAES